MRASRMIIRALVATIVIASVGCSSSTEPATEPANSSDVAKVGVSLARAATCIDWFYCDSWSDTVGVVADVLDGRNRPIHDRSVTWQLQFGDGTQVGDTTATIFSTGAQTATVAFRKGRVLVGIVASVVGSDGIARSGKLFMTWP